MPLNDWKLIETRSYRKWRNAALCLWGQSGFCRRQSSLLLVMESDRDFICTWSVQTCPGRPVHCYNWRRKGKRVLVFPVVLSNLTANWEVVGREMRRETWAPSLRHLPDSHTLMAHDTHAHRIIYIKILMLFSRWQDNGQFLFSSLWSFIVLKFFSNEQRKHKNECGGFFKCKIPAQSTFWNNGIRLLWGLGATFFSMQWDNASPGFQLRWHSRSCWKIPWPLWGTLITLGCLSRHCRLSLLFIWGGQNVGYKLTGSVMCRAILRFPHPCLPLLWEVHTNVYVHIYNLLDGWLIKYIGFHSSTIVSIFQIGFAADMIEWKILTCFNIALDVFSIIISRFIPCSIIVRMGFVLRKIPVLLNYEEMPGFRVLSFTRPTGLGGTPCQTMVQIAGDTCCPENSHRAHLQINSGRDLFLKRMAPFYLILIKTCIHDSKQVFSPAAMTTTFINPW